MDAARAWLDRELAFSALLHDLRSPLTALSAVDDQAPDLVPPWQRLAALVRDPPMPAYAPCAVDIAALLHLPGSCIATFRAPPDLLIAALRTLPRAGLELRVNAGVLLAAHGVPAVEGSPAWSVRAVEEWFARGGDGLAGARVRVAARLIGAGVVFERAHGLAHGVLSLQFTRG